MTMSMFTKSYQTPCLLIKIFRLNLSWQSIRQLENNLFFFRKKDDAIINIFQCKGTLSTVPTSLSFCRFFFVTLPFTINFCCKLVDSTIQYTVYLSIKLLKVYLLYTNLAIISK